MRCDELASGKLSRYVVSRIARIGEEPEPARHDQVRFMPVAPGLHDHLGFDRIRLRLRLRLRLEQERLGYGSISEQLHGRLRRDSSAVSPVLVGLKRVMGFRAEALLPSGARRRRQVL